ncbi:MAG TPA: signal peptide peptidase SppA [Candidatus Didemnitutus sp.]|nr:signal peptide peptidase SppA [Candidatus Didemnitutus sp.]
MKNFFSSFFATLAALLVFCMGGAFLAMLVLAAFAAMGEKTVSVSKNSYLVVDLNANFQDKPDQIEGWDDFAEAFDGGGPHNLQLRAVTRAIQAAASDPDIAGLFVHGHLTPVGYGSGFAALRELHDAIDAFKASGKPVKAYLNFATTRDFYVVSGASEISINPYGGIYIPGLASQPMFYTGLFEKLGIGVQVTRVGKFKSAVEPFIRKDMSPESRAQTEKLLGDLWSDVTAGIEQSRHLTAGSLQALVDKEGVLESDQAVKNKLVDRAVYLDVILDELKKATGVTGAKAAFRQIAVKDYAKLVSGDGLVAHRHSPGKVELGAGHNSVAIVYAEGEIVDGTGNDQNMIYGDKLAREIRQLREDDSVKAIVLRVNSPGGSATASEAIQRELRLTEKQKPVVVSMGTVAASGGYWISTYSDRIFAEPTTITGSIGVFGMFLNVQQLANDKLGLSFDLVKTGKFADLETITRPKSEEELAIFQRLVDWVYGQFIAKVADSRKLDQAAVQEIAQGRVWSGVEAKKLGLVDEIGGLDAALKYAVGKVHLGDDVHVIEVPRKRLFAEVLSEALDGRHHDYSSTNAVSTLVQQLAAGWKSLTHFNDPQNIYARLPLEQGLP